MYVPSLFALFLLHRKDLPEGVDSQCCGTSCSPAPGQRVGRALYTADQAIKRRSNSSGMNAQTGVAACEFNAVCYDGIMKQTDVTKEPAELER